MFVSNNKKISGDFCYMKNHLITVVIPVYNVEDYVYNCIQSIINQTYKNLEIIVVNDGSTDKSGDICDRIAESDYRIKVIHKKNEGLSSARNIGIDNAKGKYIVFVDSDDTIDYNMIEELLSICLTNRADIAICNRYYVYDDGTKKLRYPKNKNNLIMNSEEAIKELNSFRYFDMSAWGKIYSINLFKDIRFPNGKLSEDYFIMYQLFDKAKKIVCSFEPLYYYYQRKGSISKKAELHYDFVHAAYEQMMYVERKYPNLINCVHAAYASAATTVYGVVLKSGGKVQKKDKNILQKIVRNNLKYVFFCNTLSFTRKAQLILFSLSLNSYDIIFSFYNKLFFFKGKNKYD